MHIKYDSQGFRCFVIMKEEVPVVFDNIVRE